MKPKPGNEFVGTRLVNDGGGTVREISPDGRTVRRYESKDGGSKPSRRTLKYKWRTFRKHFGFAWGQRLGKPECPYLRRWVAQLGAFSIRVHHFHRSDDARFPHDHPWWFLTLVLRGGYYDVSQGEDGDEIDVLHAGSIRFRPALHRHMVLVDYKANPKGCWTIILTGPHLRNWGFWVNGKFKKSNKYFLEHGHHPCEQP